VNNTEMCIELKFLLIDFQIEKVKD